MSDLPLWCQLIYDDLANTRYKSIDPKRRHYDHHAWKWKYRSVFSYYRRDLRNFADYWMKQHTATQATGSDDEVAEWEQEHLLTEGQPKLSLFPANGKNIGQVIKTYHHAGLHRVFPIDIDCKDSPEVAAAMARDLCYFLDDIGTEYHLFFSGKKGYHVEIEVSQFTTVNAAFLSGDEWVLIPATKVAATRIASLAGVEIDTSVYRRHQKWRRCGCPREGGRHKIWLDDASTLRHWQKFPALSKDERAYNRRPPELGYNDTNDVLNRVWERSVELVQSEPPVRVFASGHLPKGRGGYIDYEDDSIRSLCAAVERQSRYVKPMGTYKMVQCPAPGHRDRDPSAILNQNGVVTCLKCGKFSPGQVAGFVGISLTVEGTQKPPQEELDGGLERPPDKEWNAMSLRQRTRWYEVYKKTKVDSDPSDIDEMRSELGEALDDVIANGDSAFVRASVGLGKSHSTRVKIVEQGLNVLWLAPTHELLEEAAEHFQKLGSTGHRHLKKFDDVAPKCHDVPMSTGSYMDGDDKRRLLGERTSTPSRADEIEFRQGEMGLTRGSVCGTCPRNHRSESYDPNHPLGRCPFIEHVEQFFDDDGEPTLLDIFTGAGNQKIYLMPTAHVGLSTLDKVMDNVDLVVIDEAAHDWISPVTSFEKSELQRLVTPEFMDIEVWQHPHTNEIFTFRDLWNAIWKKGTWSVFQLFKQSFTDVLDMVPAQQMGPDDGIVFDDGLDLAIEMAGGGPSAYIGLEADSSYPAVVRFLRMLKQGQIISMEPTVDHNGNEHLIVVESRDMSWADETPVLVLDATATPHDGRRYQLAFDRRFRDLKFIAENEATEVVQDPEKRWSRSKVDDCLTDPETSDKPVQDLLDYVSKLDGFIGVVSWKDNPIVDKMIVEGVTSPELVAHYGALRGLDRLAGVDHLLVLSDPTVNELALKMEWCRRGGSMHDYRDHIEYTEGYRSSTYILDYPVPRGITYEGEQVIEHVVEDEVVQAIGRARGLSNDCQIHVLCAYEGRMEEFPYRVECGMVRKGSADRKLQKTANMDRVWYEALHTFKSKKAIARDSNVSYSTVKKTLDGFDLDPFRTRHAKRLYEQLGSWKKVADKMDTSPRTLRSKRKKYGDD